MDPPWFHLSIFGRNVLNYSLRRVGFLKPTAADLNVEHEREEDEEAAAVRHVGNAVFTLQVLMRSRLTPLFIASISLVCGEVPAGVMEIFKFMDQSYLGSDVYETILSNLAIIAELIVFMDDFGIPIPRTLYHIPFELVYSHRLSRKLADQGGINELLKVAKRRYTDTGLYQETLVSFQREEPLQHGERLTLVNYPKDKLLFLQEKLSHFPGPLDPKSLAMKILLRLYSLKPGVVPING